MKLALALVVLVIVCLLLAAWCLGARAPAPAAALGGALARVQGPARRRAPDPAQSPHIVVDTLNLTHWHLRGRGAVLSPALIAETIDATAPALKLRHPGRVMYVLKDRESQFNDDAARAVYKDAASRNGVYVSAAERYPDPPAGAKASAEHSARGRDDFYMGVLAHRYRCAVLTADRLRDFGSFRATVQPFHVVEYAFWRDLPHREYVRPDAAAYSRMKKPRTIHPSAYFG